MKEEIRLEKESTKKKIGEKYEVLIFFLIFLFHEKLGQTIILVICHIIHTRGIKYTKYCRLYISNLIVLTIEMKMD